MAVIVTNQMTTQILQPTTGKILPLGTIPTLRRHRFVLFLKILHIILTCNFLLNSAKITIPKSFSFLFMIQDFKVNQDFRKQK